MSYDADLKFPLSCSITVLGCFTIGLCNRYLENTLFSLFMFSEKTCYRSVTHIESDPTVPDCCGHPAFCNKVFCLRNIYPSIQIVLFFLSLEGLWRNGVSVFVGLYGSAFSCHCVIQEPHASFATSNPVIHLPATPALPRRGSVTQCPAVERSGVVGDICSSPPAKSPHHMVLFMHSLFHIPAMWKKAQKHTKSVQMTTEEIQLQETHSPPTLPWAHSGLCCMRTRMGGWACCTVCAINNYSRTLESSLHLLPLSSSHCVHWGCHVSECKQYLEPPQSQD